MSKPSASSEEDVEKEIMDLAARIGVQAKIDGIAPSQLEHLMASLESVSHDKHCLLICASFAHRQASRLGKGMNFARVVTEAMDKLYRLGLNREYARKLLGLAKWIFESVERVRVPHGGIKDFEHYISILKGGGTS